MDKEIKQCKNCNIEFTIDSDDFSFYEKIKVPAPTFCPDCRLQRRLAFRNERRLYKRGCDLCKKSIISVYSQDAIFPVYCTDCWWSDKWDASEFNLEYKLGTSFWEQYEKLSDLVPHLGMPSPSNNYNSDYTSWVDECKNCYLVFGSSKCEDVSYAELLYDCKNTYDATNCNGLELSYQCVNSKKCYRSIWLVNSVNCSNCSFCFDCRNCNDCFLSFNLRNKNYVFLNKQYSKEDYEKKVANILQSSQKFQEALIEFKNLCKQEALHRFANFVQTVNSTGNDLIQTKNAISCFDSSKLEDCRYVTYGDEIKDCADCLAIVEKSELCYENLSTRVTSRAAFVIGSWDSNLNVWLSQYVIGARNIFGCMGLRKKSFCILNKQYSEAEYTALVEQIVSDMKKLGEFGEFFPISKSAFAYNETLANDYYPLTKDAAILKGYRWKDDVGGTFGRETIKSFEMPDKIEDVPDNITSEVLKCGQCTKNFRIIQKEFDFYKLIKVPLPRQCPDCRYYDRLSFRSPRKLWHRQCMCDKNHTHHTERCNNEFETSYASDRPEIVYCEQCYQQEVS